MQVTLVRVCTGGVVIYGAFIGAMVLGLFGALPHHRLLLAVDAAGWLTMVAALLAVRGAPGLGRLHAATFTLALVVAVNAGINAVARDDPQHLYYVALLTIGLGVVAVWRWSTLLVGTVLVVGVSALAAWGWPREIAVWTAAYNVTSLLFGVTIFVGRRDSRRRLELARAQEAAASARHAEVAAQLRQVQKLEAIGTLAGGIAHDLNNVLAAIVGVAEAAAEEHAAGSQVRDDLGQILSAAQRGASLTRDLLGFARRGKHRDQPFCLSDRVEEIAAMARRTLPHRIRVVTELDDGTAMVAGDAAQMGHVIMNLCLNAADAITGDGTITVRTSTQVLAANDSATLAPGRYAVLEVVDDGAGMDEATQSRAFEPFFSTKTARQGRSGLGLAMVYGTVRDHHGEVLLRSAPGRGTTAVVRLPLCDAAVPAAQRTTGNLPAPVRGRVLVVDDEEIMRRMLRRSLHSAGIDTIEVDGGAAAVARFQAAPGEIALVVLDLAMPGMTGGECFVALRALDPGVPIVLISGFPQDQNVERLLAAGSAVFLAKPFQRDELLDAIQRVRRRSTAARHAAGR